MWHKSSKVPETGLLLRDFVVKPNTILGTDYLSMFVARVNAFQPT
jgi:hypothetical protein